MRPPAPVGRPLRLQPDLHHRVFDDDADIQAILLRQARMGERASWPSGVLRSRA